MGRARAKRNLGRGGVGPTDSTVAVPGPAPTPRFKPIDRQQFTWAALDVDPLIPPDQLARAIWEMVGRLNWSRFWAQSKAVEGVAGCTPCDPRLLASLWILAYSEGVGSARAIERRCEYHPATAKPVSQLERSVIVCDRNGQVLFTLSGRIEEGEIQELQQLLALEKSRQQLILNLRDVTLVNQDAVKFLAQCEARGIKLENCPLHIRTWIEQVIGRPRRRQM